MRHVDAIGLFDGSRRYRRAQIVPITLELWTILKTTLAVLLRLALILRKSCAASRSFLRQFSIASHQGLDALVLWEFARGGFSAASSENCGRNTQNSIDRDGRVSTRRERGRLHILLSVATALLITSEVGWTGIKASEIE